MTGGAIPRSLYRTRCPLLFRPTLRTLVCAAFIHKQMCLNPNQINKLYIPSTSTCVCAIRRVGQNRICTPYMAVCMVIFLLKIPYIHRIYVCMYGFVQPQLCAMRTHLYSPSTHTHTHTHSHTHSHTHTHMQTDLLQRFKMAQEEEPGLMIKKVEIGSMDVTELLETMNLTQVWVCVVAYEQIRQWR